MRRLLAYAVVGSLMACAHTPNPDRDPYAWLEESQTPKTLSWVKRETAASLKELTGDPRYAKLHQAALQILSDGSRLVEGRIQGGRVYHLLQDPAHPKGLWRRARVQGYLEGSPSWEPLLDLDALSKAEGKSWVFAGGSCAAPLHQRCVVRLSEGGEDAVTLRELDLKMGVFVKDGFQLPRAKSEVAWLDADTLLVATGSTPSELTRSGYPKTVRRWRRGTPITAAEVLWVGEDRDVAMGPAVFDDGSETYAFLIRSPSFHAQEYRWLRPGGAPVKLPLPPASELHGVIAGQAIFLLKAPWTFGSDTYQAGDLVSYRLREGRAEWMFSASPRQAILEVGVTGQRVFVALLDMVRGKLLRIEREGEAWIANPVPLPEHGTVSLVATDVLQSGAVVAFESLTQPKSLYWVGQDGSARRFQALNPLYDATDVVVEQRSAQSRDGTRVPYFIMGQKKALRGPSPTLLYGYGGFQVPILPEYLSESPRPQNGAIIGKLWVEQGGLLVLANLRGGGEFGPSWHQAALKANRQRAFDDFIAIAEQLVQSGVTTTAQLGAIGRSNGGLLLGAVLTQRPRLFRAFDIGVPLLDMLRYSELSAGASWIGEYGDPSLPEERAWLKAYSPYQNLRPGAGYPRVLLFSSSHDDRVHPSHARKFAARLAEFGRNPLYIESEEGGHAGDTNAQMARRIALELTYFYRELVGR